MDVHPPNSVSVEPLVLYEFQDFAMLCHLCFRQSLQQSEHLSTIPQGTTRQFPDDERVRQHLLFVEKTRQLSVAGAEMIDPDGSIDQDHATEPGRRRRTGFSLGSVAPSLARRRALARAISASRPRRTSAVFFATPVSLAAFCSSSRSMFSVVLISICIMMHE